MSSDDIAQRLTRTADFLKQADTNHNGVIEPDEAADPQAKNMLDRIFSRMGKEPHFPMAISEIMQNYEAYYRTRASGGAPSPAGPPPGGSSPAAGWSSPPGMGFGATVAPAPGAIPAAPSGGFPNGSVGRPMAPTVPGAAGTTLTLVPPSGAAPSLQAPGAMSAVASPAVASPTAPSATGAPSTVPSLAASSPTDTKPAPRKPGRFKTARERLPTGLPDWFLEKDGNGDGQVTMAEFTDNWTPEKLAEFARYDLNHDGIITAAECLKVEKAKGGSK